MCRLKFAFETAPSFDLTSLNKGHPLTDYTPDLYHHYLTLHEYSRANNVIKRKGYERHPHHLLVKADTLIQLREGPHKGKFMGANLFNLTPSSQQPSYPGAGQYYIAAEAPYDREAFYQMMVQDEHSVRVMVSLTQDEDNYKHAFRGKYRVDLHHLNVGERVKLPLYTITCATEAKLNLHWHEDTILVKDLIVTPHQRGQRPYILKHIVYKNWRDGGDPKDMRSLISLLDIIDAQTDVTRATEQNPIAINCIFGVGRTNSLILMHQLKKMFKHHFPRTLDPTLNHPLMSEEERIMHLKRVLQDPHAIEVDYPNLYYTIANKVMEGAASIPPDGPHCRLICEFPRELLRSEIEKLEEKLCPPSPSFVQKYICSIPPSTPQPSKL